MAQEEKFVHKASSGSLFKNDYKEKETHPDYTGSCTDPNGNVYDLAGWVSKTKDGKSYFSLKIEHPFEKKEEANTQTGKSADALIQHLGKTKKRTDCGRSLWHDRG